MISRATGLFSIFRGVIENDSGDEEDAPYAIKTGVPMSIRNAAQPIADSPNTGNPRQITHYNGRCSSDVNLQREDRIQDQGTLHKFVVDWVRDASSSTRNSDLAFTCHRVN